MAVKTFTTGEVLTAADTNTYLANSGLVYVTHVTIAAAATVVVPSCFNATFDSYRAVFSGIVNASAVSNLQMRMRNGATNETGNVYYDARLNIEYAGGSIGSGNTSAGNIASLGATGTTTNTMGFELEIRNPYSTSTTTWFNNGGDARTGGGAKFGSGFINTTTSYDSLYVAFLSGSFAASGSITVYGYRKG